MTAQQVTEVIGSGIVDSSVLAIAALGFTIQFGVTRVFNFAYGEALTLAAFFAFVVNQQIGHLSVWIALGIAAIASGVAAVIFNVGVLKPFSRRQSSPVYLFIVTYAVSFMLNRLLIIIWGPNPHEYAFQQSLPHKYGPFLFSATELIFLALVAVAMVLVAGLLRATKLGRSMRAMADDRDLALVCGLGVSRISNAAWFLSGILAGLAGVMLAIHSYAFDPSLGDNYEYLIFPAVIIGGIGRPVGAVAGALVIGLLTAVGGLIVPGADAPVIVFGGLLAMMIFRPQGVFRAVSPT